MLPGQRRFEIYLSSKEKKKEPETTVPPAEKEGVNAGPINVYLVRYDGAHHQRAAASQHSSHQGLHLLEPTGTGKTPVSFTRTTGEDSRFASEQKPSSTGSYPPPSSRPPPPSQHPPPPYPGYRHPSQSYSYDTRGADPRYSYPPPPHGWQPDPRYPAPPRRPGEPYGEHGWQGSRPKPHPGASQQPYSPGQMKRSSPVAMEPRSDQSSREGHQYGSPPRQIMTQSDGPEEPPSPRRSSSLAPPPPGHPPPDTASSEHYYGPSPATSGQYDLLNMPLQSPRGYLPYASASGSYPPPLHQPPGYSPHGPPPGETGSSSHYPPMPPYGGGRSGGGEAPMGWSDRPGGWPPGGRAPPPFPGPDQEGRSSKGDPR
mmetsp:Transcript_48139/g.71759  ORF Transcript_48139/g.71759 Transcript_48139/m.71759 type:complete len:371 (-) Transcript_48139:132-1244(-)